MSYDPYDLDRDYRPYGQAFTLGQYTARTFLWMVLGLMITFGVAVASWLTGVVFLVYRAHLIILVAALILSITMVRRIESLSVGAAVGTFVAYSALLGLTMSIYLLLYDLGSMIFVFLATALYFGALAAYGHFTRRDLSGFRPILLSGLIFLLVFGLLSLFIPGFTAFDRIMCLIGIAIFLGYTAYDTQRIRHFYVYYTGYPDLLEKASIFAALQLYLDFLNLFLYLLRFLGRRRD